MLRACLAVVGAAALLVGGAWTIDIALGAGAGSVYDSVRILGLLGVAAWIFAGSSGLAYARTGVRPWVAGTAGGLVLAVLLFVAWADMQDTTGCRMSREVTTAGGETR